MFGKQHSDWLEDACEGQEVFVEQAAPLHQVQAGRQTRQSATKCIKYGHEHEGSICRDTCTGLTFYITCLCWCLKKKMQISWDCFLFYLFVVFGSPLSQEKQMIKWPVWSLDKSLQPGWLALSHRSALSKTLKLPCCHSHNNRANIMRLGSCNFYHFHQSMFSMLAC